MSAALEPVFERIRALFKAHEGKGVPLADEPGRYQIATHEVRSRDGYRTHFGGVEVKKNYVSVHLMPVYVHPDLLDQASPALRKRMQGKSCFNFRTLDEPLLAELGRLIDRGARRFEEDGRMVPD